MRCVHVLSAVLDALAHPDDAWQRIWGKRVRISPWISASLCVLAQPKGSVEDGFKGIKTGHTDEAGYCLISSAAEGGRGLLAVVLDGDQESVWTDSAALLQWGLRNIDGDTMLW